MERHRQSVSAALALVALLGVAAQARAAVAHAHSDAGQCGAGHQGNMGAACAAPAVSTTFTYTPSATGNGVLFFVSCAAASAPSAVSLSASGWSTSQVGGIVGGSTEGWGAMFKAYAPNTSAATFTLTWTSASCASFMNDLVDEFSGIDPSFFLDASASTHNTTGGCVLTVAPNVDNTGLWFACNDNVTAVTGAFTKGGDDLGNDWSEWEILGAGTAGVSQSAGYTSSGAFVIFAATVKPPGGGVTRTLLGVGKAAQP